MSTNASAVVHDDGRREHEHAQVARRFRWRMSVRVTPKSREARVEREFPTVPTPPFARPSRKGLIFSLQLGERVAIGLEVHDVPGAHATLHERLAVLQRSAAHHQKQRLVTRAEKAREVFFRLANRGLRVPVDECDVSRDVPGRHVVRAHGQGNGFIRRDRGVRARAAQRVATTLQLFPLFTRPRLFVRAK